MKIPATTSLPPAVARGTGLVIAVVTCLLSAVVPVFSLEIVYPANQTYVVRSDFLVIKGGANPVIEGMVVDINGVASDVIDVSSPEYRAAFADFLILQPELSAGKNLIEVRGLAGGKEVARQTADVFYLNGDPTVVAPASYRPFVMHLPEKERQCEPCHVMNPDKVQLGSAEQGANPCASCHKSLVDKKYVHGPAGVWGCGDCHDGSSRPARWQVRPGGGGLCNECHFDKVDEYSKSPFVHGPVGVGMCTLCHDPHASDNPSQLLTEVNRICMGCHTAIGEGHVVRGFAGKGHPLKGKKDPLRPERPFTCVSCHNPHSGEGSALLAKKAKGRYELCKHCHKK